MNIIFTGVGGQGVILSGKILMGAAQNAGYDIKESEVHGMAQRGGTVDCCVRYAKKLYSPLIELGTADYIVSFELIEIMRKLDYLAPDGRLIVNDLKIDPAPVQTGEMKYPNDISEWLRANIKNSQVIDTEGALKDLGSRKSLNIVMLGALSKHLEFSNEQWKDAITEQIKPQLLEMNLKAFALGQTL
ncbi:MAG: indolepyruvate oxidoreductase subunit beta [Spirochaetia bacterium]|jgi:indolepyruvate ferredoxin oxidoreductase beta subunit|nr:indolepyruvate oxidoreductase subunit beta [Spirochaetia bacterium]